MRSRWARAPTVVNHAPETSSRRGEAHRRPPLCGGGVGWRGLPLRTIKGADSGFRRTYGFHPRRAKRRAQVCGEVTVGSDGQGNQQSPAPVLAPHPPRSGPPSPQGEGQNALQVGRDFPRRALNSTLHSPLSTLLIKALAFYARAFIRKECQ